MAGEGKILSEGTEAREISSKSSSMEQTAEEQRAAIPDGGAMAWLQVAGAFFVYFSSWGLINTFGTFETYYITVLPETPSNIAWIGTTEGFLLVVIGVLVGALQDRGFFRVMVAAGSFLVVFGMMMTSLCTQYYQFFLAQGLCVGIGCGLIFLPSLIVVATYFSKKRGFATGITAAGGQVGGVVFPIVFRQLNKSIGFGWAVRVIAFLTLAMLLFSNAVMKPRVPPTRKALVDTTAFRDPAYLFFCFGLFVTFIGLYQPLYYTPTYGEVLLGMGLNESFYLTAITNGCSIAGCIIPSFLSDHVGPLNLIIPSALMTSVLGFTWIGVKSVHGLQALVAFYGFFTGILISLPNPILVSLSPSLDRVGTRVGMGYTFAAFGLLLGSPLGGLLINIPKGDFLDNQIWAGCWVFGGALCFATSKFLHVRRGQPKGI